MRDTKAKAEAEAAQIIANARTKGEEEGNALKE